MIPIETYYSNIIFSAGGCKDLHGTLIHNEDGPGNLLEAVRRRTEAYLPDQVYLSLHYGPLDSSGDAVCHSQS